MFIRKSEYSIRISLTNKFSVDDNALVTVSHAVRAACRMRYQFVCDIPQRKKHSVTQKYRFGWGDRHGCTLQRFEARPNLPIAHIC